LQRGMTDNLQGQMVSGRYVGASPLQGIANIYSAYKGGQMTKEADRKQAELAQMLRQQTMQDLQGYGQAMRGQEATPDVIPQGQTLLDDQGMMTMGAQRGTAAVAPDPNKALGILMGSRSPQSQALAQALMADQMKTIVAPEGSTIYRGGIGGAGETIKGTPKSPEKIQTAAIVLGLDSKPRETWTAQDRANIDAQIQKTQQSGAMNTGQKGLDNVLKLRGDFRSEPIYKDFQAIDSAYRQITKGLDAGTAAGDLAASTKLMKLLDPTSVVRESELVMAMQATGKLDQLYNYANKIATGQFLSSKQKQEFRDLSKEFYNSAGEQYNLKRQEYADIAQRNELNVPDVVGSDVKLLKTKPPVGKGGLPTTQDLQAEIDRRLGLKQQPQGGR